MTHHKALFFAFAFVFLLSFTYAFDDHHECTHNHKDHPEPLPLDVEEDMSFLRSVDDNNRILSSSYPNMRIYGNYDHMNTAPTSYKNYIQNELGPAVISYFQAALQVKYPVSGRLTVPSVQSQLCGYATPSVLFNPGVSADYFIMFDSQYDSSSGWIADSYVCFMASGTNRPLISTTKFNRAQLLDPLGDILVHEKNCYLLIHEMTHTFGFTASMFPYYLDQYGNRRSGHIKSGSMNGQQSTIIDVPPLTNMLRNFFGCSSLAGAYLENSGTSGTAGSHFNRRQFLFDHMTSGLLFQQRVSEFAFGMLEGSGWYIPNYNYAEPYSFGRGQGCGFLFNSCTSSGFNYNEFCTGTQRGCTFEGRGGGNCMSDTRSAGCRYHTTTENYDCENPNAARYALVPELQVFGRGSGSRCFSGTLVESGQNPTASSYCFNYKCQGSGSNTVLTVSVGKWVLNCHSEGPLTIKGYNGYVNCPDPITYCNTVGLKFCPRNCMGRGNCVNNQCQCYTGYTGNDCAVSTYFGLT